MALPRLLTRREIDVKKAQEQQRRIDEGSKLARTVDSLRELRSEEEQKFEEWRKQTLAEIQSKIDKKAVERDILDSDLRTKRLERETLMKPLTEEWAKVTDAREKLDWDTDLYKEDKANLASAIALNIQRERRNATTAGQLISEAKTVALIKAGAVNDARESRESRIRATKAEEEVASQIVLRLKAIDDQEYDLALRKNNIRLREIATKEQAKKNTDERQRLKDLENTLERAFKRLNKNNGKRG